MEKTNQNLRKWIEKLGLTQNEVARRTGLGQSTVSQHLSGARQLSNVASIQSYAELGIPLEELMPERKRSDQP